MAITKKYMPKKKLTKVTFSLPVEAAPAAKDVRVVGDFNNWSWEKATSMKLSKNVFKTELEFTAEGNYEFRYQIDGKNWENDWAADAYVPAPFDGIDNSVVVVEPKQKTVAKKAAPKAAKAKTKKKPSKKAKDLTVIEGVGPKLKQILTDAGYGTFELVAAAKADDLKTVLLAAGSRYKMFDPTTWPQQATLAAAGQWEDLKTLQDKLDGGKLK